MSMKEFFSVLSIVAACLVILATACQLANKGDGKSAWQLRSPGAAAGYGRPPLDTSDSKDTSAEPPAADNLQQVETPGVKEPRSQQPATTDDGPSSSPPAWKIKPPPSAAGYDRPMLDTPSSGEENNQQETTPPKNESTPHQAPSQNGRPGSLAPTWTIKPPPSAAGYGK